MYLQKCSTYSDRRNSQIQEKPVVIVDYNQYMLGVDKLDQLTSYYSFLHKTVKWWRKVFFWLLEVAVVNSHIIYKENCILKGEHPLNQLHYRRKIIDILSQPQRQSREVHVDLHSSHNISYKKKKRRDCIVCSERQLGGTRHLTLYICETCNTNPPLCSDKCFKKYHTENNPR